eukprot:3380477-Alexandrium_andersonii.AAC.1
MQEVVDEAKVTFGTEGLPDDVSACSGSLQRDISTAIESMREVKATVEALRVPELVRQHLDKTLDMKSSVLQVAKPHIKLKDQRGSWVATEWRRRLRQFPTLAQGVAAL